MKWILAFFLISGVCLGQIADSTHIDASASHTDSLYLGMNYGLSAVVIDTPWTASNIGFESYNFLLGKWCEVIDKDGNDIEYTVGSITKPTKVVLKATDTYLLGKAIKIVSQVSGTDSVQAAQRSLVFEKARIIP